MYVSCLNSALSIAAQLSPSCGTLCTLGDFETTLLGARHLLLPPLLEQKIAARRADQPPPGPYPHHFQSLSHAASLTARQARRSGVSQQDLRARWA